MRLGAANRPVLGSFLRPAAAQIQARLVRWLQCFFLFSLSLNYRRSPRCHQEALPIKDLGERPPLKPSVAASHHPRFASLPDDWCEREENGPLSQFPIRDPHHQEIPSIYFFHPISIKPTCRRLPVLLCQVQRRSLIHLRASPKGNPRECLRLQVSTLETKPQPSATA